MAAFGTVASSLRTLYMRGGQAAVVYELVSLASGMDAGKVKVEAGSPML